MPVVYCNLMSDIANEEIQLCERMMSMFDQLRVAYAEAADRHGLTKAQIFALYNTCRATGEVTMNTLAQELHCDASNVTGIVDRLSAQDLLNRVESSRDRRVKILVPTPKGKKLIEDLRASLPCRLGCDKLSETERTNLSDTLHKMCQ
jgi:DNA-binding MarR family transcriptional regulator